MFLPRFLLLLLGLWFAMSACTEQGNREPSGTVPPDVFQVVVGSGELGADRLELLRTGSRDALQRLQPLFGRSPRPFTVFVHADRAGMPVALQPHLLADSPAFALLGAHQVHIVWGELIRTGTGLRATLLHEFTHELLDQYVASGSRLLPRWFHEGLAQSLARDTYLGAREEDLVYRIVSRRLSTFSSLRERFPTDPDELRYAYAQSYSYVNWLLTEFGLDELLAVARAADDITSFEHALVGRTRRSALQLEDAWREYLLHGSGATWRVVFEQCFSYLMILALPVLALALVRRFASERRAAARMATLPTFEPRVVVDAETVVPTLPPEALADPIGPRQPDAPMFDTPTAAEEPPHGG